jgi:hypothetical protein
MYLTVEQRGTQICLFRARYAPRKSAPSNSRIFSVTHDRLMLAREYLPGRGILLIVHILAAKPANPPP